MKNTSMLMILLPALPCLAASGTRVTREIKINRTANHETAFLDIRAAPAFSNLSALSSVADDQASHGANLVYRASVVWGAKAVGGGVVGAASDLAARTVTGGSTVLGVGGGIGPGTAFRSMASN